METFGRCIDSRDKYRKETITVRNLKKIVKDIFIILDRREKIVLGKLILSDVIVSVLDIGFLVALLYIVHFYTEGSHPVQPSWLPVAILKNYPLLATGAFFILFCM